MLHHANILKLNDEELPVLAKLCSITGDETVILKKLLEKYDVQLIALTKGSKGSRLVNTESDSNHKVQSVKVKDSVGAGDAFTAAMIMGLLHKLPLKEVHEKAALLASFVCTHNGATPKLTEELKKKLHIT